MKMHSIFLVGFAILTLCSSVPVRDFGTRRNTYFYHNRNGFYYHINRVVRHTRTAYMKCIRYERGCLGRGIWLRGGNIQSSQPHTCRRDAFYPLEMQCRRNILRRCRDLDMVPYTTIIRQERRGFPIPVQLRMTYPRLRTSMRNARLASLPNPPDTIQEFARMFGQNPNLRIATMTSDGQDNLFRGSVVSADGSNSIIFASRRMLRFARRQPVLFIDGTFSTVPPLPQAAQILTIITSHDHHVIPVAWVLMSRQTAVAYTSVFRLLRILLGPGIALQQIITDFEQGLHIGLNTVFGPQGVLLQGCFFHLARALIKYAKRTLNLRRHMAGGPIRNLIRLTMSLALLPLNMVNRGYRIIMLLARREGRAVYQRFRPFLAYVLRRWVHHRTRRELMNCCGSENRTNNICETHHSQLSRHIGIQHPNVYHLLMALSDFESDAFLAVNAINEGVRIHRPRRIQSIMTDAQLRNHLHTLLHPRRLHHQLQPLQPNNRAILTFMRRASYVFEGLYDQALEDM